MTWNRYAARRLFLLLAVVLFVLSPLVLVGALAFAQTIDAPPGSPQAFPWETMAVNAINALQVILIPALAAGIKDLLKRAEVRVPRFAILSGVVMLGVLAESLNAWVGAGGFSLFRGAIMGLLAVALREVVDTAKEHGFTGK